MICPILPTKEIYSPSKNENTFIGTECKENNCAWYDHDQKQCAVLSININLIKAGENQ
jgi:hypothetical protein